MLKAANKVYRRPITFWYKAINVYALLYGTHVKLGNTVGLHVHILHSQLFSTKINNDMRPTYYDRRSILLSY